MGGDDAVQKEIIDKQARLQAQRYFAGPPKRRHEIPRRKLEEIYQKPPLTHAEQVFLTESRYATHGMRYAKGSYNFDMRNSVQALWCCGPRCVWAADVDPPYRPDRRDGASKTFMTWTYTEPPEPTLHAPAPLRRALSTAPTRESSSFTRASRSSALSRSASDVIGDAARTAIASYFGGALSDLPEDVLASASSAPVAARAQSAAPAAPAAEAGQAKPPFGRSRRASEFTMRRTWKDFDQLKQQAS